MLDRLDVLIVDDEPGIRTTLAEILKDEGYNVVVAENGYKGIDAAKKTNFNFAIIDMKMPGLNGIDTLKRIKRISPDTKIFFMTAFLAEDVLDEEAKRQTHEIFYKPIDIDLILKIMKN
ncbi:MAG: response regulator [Candidatus Brocadiaceae bacterium]|nr:response regulator [Candidatus Brocadiaceae bacterium]